MTNRRAPKAENETRSAATERQAQAVRLLALGWRRGAVARRLEVDRNVISKWLQDPDFRARLDAYMDELDEAAKREIVGAAKAATHALRRCLRHKDPHAVIKAAKELLDRNARFGPVKSKVEHSGEVKGLRDMPTAELLEAGREALKALEAQAGKEEADDGTDS